MLGVTRGFARVVASGGHASEVTNNPYRASLDCGACGGHSGEPNARVAAALLNDPDVRIGLAARGIDIPADTWFVAALHNTTTDEIDVCDRHLVPASHYVDLDQIELWMHEAGRLSRMERSPRLNAASPEEIMERGHDWAEVRPEWGLAGNAAFIAAPRSRTHALNLGGRSFLHSYDHRLDPDLKVLELIMTAPMVVANWINLQYYASAVDPVALGSGNKLLHNVVGQFGVLQGNGGDLMTGLPWQSVHDGEKLQHEPLRLLVVIDAPRTSIRRIIEKHSVVRNLVSNGWVSLLAWEDDQFHRLTAQETWELQVSTPCSPSLN
ncbi:MAG: Na-translocating system protein MpsB [Planctomycetota bacterium]|nr:Na-translocating system protein MpsB [Planctomycetota bacterium]